MNESLLYPCINSCRDFWYETRFHLDADTTRDVILRFGSITHRATIFVNGIKAGEREGGFTPVVLDSTPYVRFNNKNRISVLMNNKLNETSIPKADVYVSETIYVQRFPDFISTVWESDRDRIYIKLPY